MENVKKMVQYSMNDIVFEKRNKAYGAYAIRTSENERLKIAFLCLFGFITMAFFSTKAFGYFFKEKSIAEIETIVEITDVNIEKETEPLKIEKPKVPKGETANATAVHNDYQVVANNANVADTLEETESFTDKNIGAENKPAGSTDGCIDCIAEKKPIITEIPEKKVIENTKPIDIAEIMPEFEGGEEALMRFLANNIEYPEFERENLIDGKNAVRFVVNENGSVSNVEVVRKSTSGFDKESIRVVSLLPKFKPGKQGGRNVKVRMVVPIVYKLK